MDILVLEDETAIRRTIAAALRSCGHDIAAVETGLDAVAYVDAHRPDLVVLDLNLPVMDGWEFLQVFRKRPGCADVPVVVVTAERGVSASKLGAQAFLGKPFDLEELLATVEALLLEPGVDAQKGASLHEFGSQHRP